MLDVNVWTNRLIGRDRELAALGSLLDEASAPLLHATTQAWLADLARAVTASPATREREAVGDAHRI